MKIAVRYCGGCNPCIDRVGIVKRVALLLGGNVDITYNAPEEESDFLLVIDGCSVGCRGNEICHRNKKAVFVAGNSVQDNYIDEEDIPAAIVEHLGLLKDLNS